MPQPLEKRLTAEATGGQSLPVEQDPTLGNFFEPLQAQDQTSFLSMALNQGNIRRIAILNAIFSRCRQEGTCLIWQGPTSGEGRGGGYGRFSFEGVTSAVHRAVYATVHGPIPPKKQIDHECNNRLCCNPLHLKHMTHKKNQKLRDQRRS